MNKKMKVLLALTLIIQLLIPSYLLYHHYTVMDTALNSAEEYRFRIDSLEFEIPTDPDADYECESVYFRVTDIEAFYNKKIAVTLSEDGFPQVDEVDNSNKSDCWFDYKHYKQSKNLYKEDFAFNADIAVRYTLNKLRKEYAWYNKNDEDRKYAYVSAKIYKGRFIPTAIYFEGIKVITINNN